MKNEFLKGFEHQTTLNALGDNNMVRPFWMKNSQNYSVKKSTQAALTALFKAGLLSCEGEPGKMRFYRTSSYSSMRWFYKVDSALVVGTIVITLLCLMSWFMNMASAFGDFLAISVAMFSLVFCWKRVGISCTYSPLMAYVPGLGKFRSRTRYNITVGYYIICLIFAVGILATVLFRFFTDTPRISSNDLEMIYMSVGVLIEAIILWPFNDYGYEIILMALGIVAGISVGAPIAAWFVGVCFHSGYENSTKLLSHYGLLQLYVSDGLNIHQAHWNPMMALYGLIPPVYMTILMLAKLWG